MWKPLALKAGHPVMAWLNGRPAADLVQGLVPRSLQRNGIRCGWEALIIAELTDGFGAQGAHQGQSHQFPLCHPHPNDTAWEEPM
ncbi:hypothetical protein GCM10010523_21090 [Paenarthrobacter ilicis]